MVDFSVPRREGHGRGAGFVPATGTQVRSCRCVVEAEEGGRREGGFDVEEGVFVLRSMFMFALHLVSLL